MPTCLFVRIAVKYVFVKACSIRLCYGKNPFILGVHSTQNGRMANVLVSDIMYRKSHALDQPTPSPTPSPPLVHSKLDYCNSLYSNLPKTQINRLQHIQNSLARTVANTPKYSHITPVLKSLHWLKNEQRSINWFLLLTKFSPPVNLLTYIISSLFKPTIILVPLMLSHLLVHLPPLPLRSQITLFSMPRLISGINFLLHFVNQFHLFMLTSIHPSVLHFPHPSPLHSFTLNLKLTSLVNHFPHRSLTIDISDWLPRLLGPFSVFTVFVGVISCSWWCRQN